MQVVTNIPPVRFRFVDQRSSVSDLPTFQEILPPRVNRWPAFLISCLIHLLLILGLPVLAEYLPLTLEDEKRLEFSARSLDIRVPEKLYLASGSGEAAKSPTQSPAKQSAASKPAPPTHAAAAKRAPKTFELPDLPIQAKGNQTLLQPQYAPQLAPQENVQLPEVMFWASEAMNLHRPAAKPFVLPGHKTAVTQAPPKLDAPPRLEMPNRATATADMTVSGVSLDRTAALPRPASTTMPIRTFDPPKPGPVQRGATIDVLEGDPTNVLALAPNAPPLSEVLHVPPGNLRAPLLITPPSASNDGGIKITTSASSGGFGARGAAATAGSGTAVVSLGKPTGLPPTTVPGALSSAVTQLSAGLALKVVHPMNGVFDIVVQSSTSDAMPESAGILSGRPIYTVYLKIGAAKDWILQYCIPSAVDAKVTGDVLQLSAPAAPVKAPFPQITFRPLAELQGKGGYLMIHGKIDEAGKFKNLKTAGKADTRIGALLLAFLQNWKFRPATQAEVPVAVEILLAVPPGA